MAKFVPKILDPLLGYVPDNTVEDITSYASKAMRLKIIADRYTRGFIKADRKGGKDSYEHERMDPEGNKEHRLILGRNDSSSLNDGSGSLIIPPYKEAERRDAINNPPTEVDYISIIDIDWKPIDKHKRLGHREIKFPFVPLSLEYNIESSFVGIASPGRNNPFYQYTGSEDTITLNIDWFSDLESRVDVIQSCRRIEALTKADSYDEPPHRVILSWGKDNIMFDGVIWLVVSANYVLSDFTRAYRNLSGDIKPLHMLPQQARQEVKLKRLVTKNLSSAQIMNREPLLIHHYNTI